MSLIKEYLRIKPFNPGMLSWNFLVAPPAMPKVFKDEV